MRPRPHTALLGALAALIAVLFLPAAAGAATSYSRIGSFGEDIAGPTGIAVDPSTGAVLVVDSTNARVLVFEPSGSSVTQVAEFGGGELLTPQTIAVDPANGDVYVSDPNSSKILRYHRTATNPPAYAVDGTYVSPPQGSGAGEIGSFNSPLAIDPTDGDLVIADTGNLDVARFTSAGTFVGSFDGEGSEGGVFTGLLDLAIDPSGHIYTVNGAADIFGAVTEGRVNKFSSTGAPEGPTPNPPAFKSARAVAFDSSTGNLVVAVQGESGAPSAFWAYHGSSFVARVAYPESTAHSAAADLGVDGGPSGRLYALTTTTFFGYEGVNSVQVYSPQLVPDLVLDSPSNVTATGAHLSGTVNPLGTPTQYRFEYSADGVHWHSTPEEDAGAGEAAQPVSADISLGSNTTYSVRLSARTSNGEAFSEELSFTTPVGPPAVGAVSTSGVTSTEATLNGSVNPFGLESTYRFEYGTSTAYGSRTPAPNDGVLGHGRNPVPVSRIISGLQPGTTYHYRLVAENSVGISEGEDRTFTTSSQTAERAYELVSPAEKEGAPVTGYPLGEAGFQANATGDAMVYTTKMALPGGESSPLQSRAEATRGADGWTTRTIDPPLKDPLAPGHLFWSTLAVSEDLSHALVVSLRKLTPEAVEDQYNLYVKDIASNTYELVGSSPKMGELQDAGGQFHFLGGTPDFSIVSFVERARLTADAPESGNSINYLWSRFDGLKVISKLPDGSPVSGEALDITGQPQARHQVSVTGARTFVGWINGSEEGLYVYQGGKTSPLSVSHIEGGSSIPQSALFLGATADGSEAMFVDAYSTTPLTPDAPAASRDVYVANLETGALSYVATKAESVMGVSEDLDYLYFSSSTPIDPSEPGFGNFYWVAHDGSTKLIASSQFGESITEVDTSPNGRYFAFRTSTPLTGFATSGDKCPSSGCEEIYVYDAEAETLTCASCSANGGQPTGTASMGREGTAVMSRHQAAAVTDAGQVFFDTPDSLVGADTNGTRDVYEYDARSGNVSLISEGRHSAVSALADATPDGKDVFFVTNARLVPKDVDVVNDLYDARVGGGFAGEGMGSENAGCDREDCTARAEAPVSVALGSEQLSGSKPHRSKHHKVRKRHRCRRSRPGKGSKRVKACTKRHKSHKTGRQVR
jgi:DNA-binding beta-propeller fold protein YncE